MRSIVGVLAVLLVVACGSDKDSPATSETTTQIPQTTGSTTTTDTTPSTAPEPLLVGLMVHLEGHPLNEHDEYKANILAYADIFDEYGAKPTWEAKEPIFSSAERSDPYLKGLEDRGHGVGVHADVGFAPWDPTYDYNKMVIELTEMKSLLELQNVTVNSVSGICSDMDWVSAAIEADYKFVSGLVAYCTLSLPPNLIPAEFADCAEPADCHDPYPGTLEERMHPWRVSAPNWLEYDPEGALVLMPEATVGLPLCDIYLDPVNGGQGMELTAADLDGYFQELDKALDLRDPNQVNTFFQLWSYGLEVDEIQLRDWLARLQQYEADGKIQWATLSEMHATYEAWEASQ